MYVHCHSCRWQQDDFYSVDGYNPASFLKSMNKDLCEKDLDKDMVCIDERSPAKYITRREYITRYYEQYANHIREMKWITYQQFVNDPDKRCPKCGSENLDID